MKIFNRDGYAAAAALLVTGCIAFTSAAPCRAAQSAAAPAGASTFGSINLQKINTGYTKKAAMDNQIQELNDKLSARLKQQAVSDMLTREQQQQYSALLDKAAPTDQDRATITALQAQSTRDAQELASLQQKQNLSDTEKARLSALTNQQQGGRQALQEVNDQYSEQIKSAVDKMSVQLTDLIRAAVASVAKDKGLAMVFTSDVAIYSANDITDDVLKHLNK